VVEHSPGEITLLEVLQSRVLDTVRHTDVHSVVAEHAVNLTEHLVGVRAGTVTAENGVESSLINDSLKGAVIVVHAADVHLLEGHGRILVLTEFLLALDDRHRQIDVLDVRVAIVSHLLGESRVAAPDIKNGETRLHILRDDVLQSIVSLIPIELFLLFVVTVFPVLNLSVLCHLKTVL